MTYLREAPSVFPGGATPGSRAKPRSGAGRASTSTGKKRACKYGPRDADGYCPKKPRAARGGRKKPPCKYGPRDADGYCPKKPRAEEWGGWEPEPEPKPKPRKKTRAETAAKRRLNTAVERAATRTITAGATKVLKSKGAARTAEGAARTARYLGTNVTALSGAGAGGAVGLAIAAGVGAFMATRSILARIRDKKERAQEAAFVAAQNMRRTRLDAEARLGRALTRAELGQIRDAFNLTELMRKAGL